MNLELNEYGNVDCRNGMPEGWVSTGATGNVLKAAGIEYAKGCFGFEQSGKYWRPMLGNIIRQDDVARLEEYRASKRPVKRKTAEEKQEAWCRRLDKLTGCGMEEARRIAEEKLLAQAREIEAMETRQYERGYSVRRASLIGQMERANPLRRIESEDHAEAILAASRRHRGTNYEALLKAAHKMEEWGELEKGEAKAWAREHMETVEAQ